MHPAASKPRALGREGNIDPISGCDRHNQVIVTNVNIYGDTDQPSFVALFGPDSSYLG